MLKDHAIERTACNPAVATDCTRTLLLLLLHSALFSSLEEAVSNIRSVLHATATPSGSGSSRKLKGDVL